MKRFCFFIAASFILLLTNAQNNVNVDNYRFNHLERETPAKPLNPRSFYYATQIIMPGLAKNYVDEESLYNGLGIEGQRITDNPTENDVIVTLTMQTLNILDSRIETRTVKKKDKEGRERREHYYSMVITYNFQSDVVLSKGKQVIATYNLFNYKNNMTYQTEEFPTSRAVSEYWKLNRENLRENFTKEVSFLSVTRATETLTKNFGFPIKKSSNLIKTINEKKHPENQTLRAMADALKARLEALDGTHPIKEEEISDIIFYFKGIPTRYTDEKSKADIRLRYVAYYNLCKIYLLLDMPEKVQQYADAITANGYDKKDGERIMKDAVKLMELFNRTGIKGRQFDPDSLFVD